MKEIKTIFDFIINEKLILPKDSILVAVSGGIDSVCLLDILFNLKDKLKIKKISVAHFNHKLRDKESQRDEEFVKNLAKKYELDFYAECSNIKKLSHDEKLSVQECARNYRLDFLQRIAVKSHSNKIATGHNKDDLAETSLMWLIRGTSLEGLKGIAPRRDKFIRPLLLLSRSEIKNYAIRNNILNIEDSSNAKNDYLRNYIRNKLFPIIEENCNKNAKNNIARFASIIKDDVNYLDVISKKYEKKYFKDILFGKEIKLDIFNKLHPSIQKRILKNVISFISANSLKNIMHSHLLDIISIAKETNTGAKTLNLPANIIASKTYSTLKITKNTHPLKLQNTEFEINFPGLTLIEEFGLSITCAILPGGNEIDNYNLAKQGFSYFDYDKIKFPLKIRLANFGDKFQPLGSLGIKKLSDFFIDKKIPADIRWITPVITSNENIIWVLSHRIDEKYKVNHSSKNVLQISYKYV